MKIEWCIRSMIAMVSQLLIDLTANGITGSFPGYEGPTRIRIGAIGRRTL